MNHFAFTKLIVADLDRMAAFYEAVFGLKPQARIKAEVTGRPIEEIVYEPTAPGASSFVLFAFLDAKTPAAGETITGFSCSDLDGAVEKAVALGGSVPQPARDAPEHGLRVGFIADPEGHLIELIKPL
jgi:predicted enzyme related to lactoylglutathione lyase